MTYLYQNKISYYSSHLHVFCSVNRSVSSGSGSNIVGIVHSDVTFIRHKMFQHCVVFSDHWSCLAKWSRERMEKYPSGYCHTELNTSMLALSSFFKPFPHYFFFISPGNLKPESLSNPQPHRCSPIYPSTSFSALPRKPLSFRNSSGMLSSLDDTLFSSFFLFGEQTCSGLQMLNPFTIPLTSKRTDV